MQMIVFNNTDLKKDLFDISKRDQIRASPEKVTKIKATKMRIHIRQIYH